MFFAAYVMLLEKGEDKYKLERVKFLLKIPMEGRTKAASGAEVCIITLTTNWCKKNFPGLVHKQEKTVE